MILTLIGARPQFVKAAVVSKALLEEGVEELIIHSGQHYDDKMSNVFWNELGIPKPFANLNIGSGNHGEQTANIMIQLESLILKLNSAPKALMVYGDTNTTMAGALVASKLHIPVIHIEAGLRSYNRSMPEEINRIVTDHLSDILFCPSELSVNNLQTEGVINNVHVVGDVMYDAVKTFTPIAQNENFQEDYLNEKFILLTLHRPVNTDDPAVLQHILNELGKVDQQIIWPVHPRNKQTLSTLNMPANLRLIEPLSYLEMLNALNKCSRVITDSGGLQKEAYWSKKPCLTLRTETEWKETLINNWNILIDINNNNMLREMTCVTPGEWSNIYGEGNAANKIAKFIKNRY